MPDNVLRVGPEVFAVVSWTIVLFGLALSFAFKYRAGSDKAGVRGHRPADESEKGEISRPDGFIDTFSGVISEAGGGMPWMATVIMLVIVGAYFLYLIRNWNG